LDVSGSRVTLGDYTAFADAMLQGYLATGDEGLLLRGRDTLDRARFLFFDPDLKVAVNGVAREGDLSSRLTALPELADGEREATTAAFVRLSALYSQLDPEGSSDKARGARETVSTAARSAREFQFRLGGLYHAAGIVMADFCVAVSGRAALRQASDLARLVPGVLVFPTCPQARPDLVAEGVYFVRGGEAEGPLTAEQARRRLVGAP
jgi:uncharacterized protein YyaL (SSP411 family)